jgi:BirA family biotin operon repressor/biotin-[acetyl-CoA-carboxylase] ligase
MSNAMPQHITLNKASITPLLSPTAKKTIQEIMIEGEITSTNDILLASIKNHPTHNTVLIAESQTAGRGRLDKKWRSPPHCNIYLSLSWYFEKSQQEISGLSITVGECIIHALQAYGISEKITLKWPNDLLYQNQKLCGILIETVPINTSHAIAVIGIGLNVNHMDENNITIDQPWTSLQKITHKTHDRNQLIAHLLNALSHELSK